MSVKYRCPRSVVGAQRKQLLILSRDSGSTVQKLFLHWPQAAMGPPVLSVSAMRPLTHLFIRQRSYLNHLCVHSPSQVKV